MLKWAKVLLKSFGITSVHFTADHKLVSLQQTYKLAMNNYKRVNRKRMLPSATCFCYWSEKWKKKRESACFPLNLNNLKHQRLYSLWWSWEWLMFTNVYLHSSEENRMFSIYGEHCLFKGEVYPKLLFCHHLHISHLLRFFCWTKNIFWRVCAVLGHHWQPK